MVASPLVSSLDALGEQLAGPAARLARGKTIRQPEGHFALSAGNPAPAAGEGSGSGRRGRQELTTCPCTHGTLPLGVVAGDPRNVWGTLRFDLLPRHPPFRLISPSTDHGVRVVFVDSRIGSTARDRDRAPTGARAPLGIGSELPLDPLEMLEHRRRRRRGSASADGLDADSMLLHCQPGVLGQLYRPQPGPTGETRKARAHAHQQRVVGGLVHQPMERRVMLDEGYRLRLASHAAFELAPQEVPLLRGCTLGREGGRRGLDEPADLEQREDGRDINRENQTGAAPPRVPDPVRSRRCRRRDEPPRCSWPQAPEWLPAKRDGSHRDAARGRARSGGALLAGTVRPGSSL